MRIIRIITRLNIGGPAIQAILMTKAFQSQTLLLTGQVGDNEGDMSYLAEEHDVTFKTIPFLARELNPVKDFFALVSVFWQVIKFRPDIIHTHTAKAGMVGRMAGILYNLGRRKKVTLIHTFHGNVFKGYFGKWKTRFFIAIERFLAKTSNVIVAVSLEQEDELVNIYKIAERDKVFVIPLGFDLTRFSSLPFPKFEKPFNVAFIGRLTAVKRPEIFLDSAIALLTGIPMANRFRFLFVGDGELRKGLEARVAPVGIKDHITFLGWVRNVEEVMKGIDVVVLTSINEGTPVTIIEAMAAGRLIIATNVGGVPDLLGSVVEERDYYDIAERGILLKDAIEGCLTMALADFALNPHEFVPIIREAKEFAIDNFSLSELTMNFRYLYMGREGI